MKRLGCRRAPSRPSGPNLPALGPEGDRSRVPLGPAALDRGISSGRRPWRPARGLAGGRSRSLLRAVPSIVVEDRAEAAVLGEQRIAAVAEQVEGELLVGLLLA